MTFSPHLCISIWELRGNYAVTCECGRRVTFIRNVSVTVNHFVYLMCKFMGNNRGHELFIHGGGTITHEQGHLPECDETPVLHGSSQEVWNPHQVC